MLEDNIGGVLGLHDAPVVPETKLIDDWTKARGKKIEPLMKGLYFGLVAEVLCPVQIGDGRKNIVHKGKADIFVC